MQHLLTIATFLEMEGIANGCGGKWGFRFEQVIEMLKQLPYFDNEKWQDLFVRLRALCSIHDEFYSLGGGWFIRWLADMWFVIQCHDLLSWVDWKIRYSASFSIYIGVRKFGSGFFNYL